VNEQLDSQGRLRHLVTLDGLSGDLLTGLMDRAEAYLLAPGNPGPGDGALDGLTVCQLFFEASTRTKISFELAARRQGADVVNLVIPTSSAAKGETVLDTLLTIQSMAVDIFVVRHKTVGLMSNIVAQLGDRASLINAGEGQVSHPTQGLLDVLTIRQHKKDFKNLSIAITGDIRHSRVARSAYQALLALGVGDLRLVAPDNLLPESNELTHGRRYTDFDAGISDCDVVMMLRLQKERMQSGDIPDLDSYRKQYCLTPQRLKLARENAIVMHPGPINRGIEMDSEIADGRQSVVRQQVGNGVAMRMAVLAAITDGKKS
jgi:aspartate carbamoyltransferase catalytic subunit